MMRSSGIEGTPRREQGAPPSPPRRGDRCPSDAFQARPEAGPRSDYEDRVTALSRRLTRLPVERADEAVRDAVETLEQGLPARHVSFLELPTSGDAQAIGFGGAPGLPIGLSGLPEIVSSSVLEALRRGETVDLGSRSGTQRPPLDLGSGWRAVGETGLVPCVGSNGLVGVLRVELGMRSARSAASCLERAGRVGDLLASFLERGRLARELAASRAEQLHGERMETLGVVASSVAHDFNNVLTAILGYAELLGLELPVGAPGHSELAEIEGAAIRATRLVEQVLAFGRRRPAGVEALDLAGTVRGLAPMIERVLGERMGLELDLQDPAPPIRVDPIRLEQLLLNLAANARDAVARNGRGRGRFSLASRIVEIDTDGRDRSRVDEKSEAGERDEAREVGNRGESRAREALALAPGPHLRLSARDDGCGIDPATRDRIFEPFFTTKSEGEGTGLGLATAAAILREAGGAIDLESEPGSGSCFHLYFPLSSR
jgi:signal transduction histidine kinase